MASSRRMTAAQLLQQLCPAARSPPPRPAGRRWSPPISRSARNAPSVASSSNAEALVPDRRRRRSRRSSRSWPAGTSSSRSQQAQEQRLARPARVGDGGQQPLLQQVETRPAQQVGRGPAARARAWAPGRGRSARSGRAAGAPPGCSPGCRGGWRRRPRGDAPRPGPAAGRAAAPPPPPSCPGAWRTDRSAASRWWLTTTTSASAARRRARNRKHRSKWGHLSRVQRSGSALTSSHTSRRGVTGRSLSVPSAVCPAHSAMPSSSSSLSCSSSVRCEPTAWCMRARQR